MATHVHIDRIGEHVGDTVTIKGWLAQPPLERQDSLPRGPRRHRLPAGRHGQEGRGRGDVRPRRSPGPGERHHRHRHGARGRAGQGRLRDDCDGDGGGVRGARLPDHAEGARRRLPDGPAAPVDSRRAPDRDPARAPRDDQRIRDFFNGEGFILADTPIFTPAACEGTTTLFPVEYFEDTHRLPDAERSALQRSQRDGARQGLHLRARPSAPRRARRAGTSPSSGWWSRRWPMPTSNDVIALAERLVASVVAPRAGPPAEGAEDPRAQHLRSSRR